jgi:uncharacterized protein (TIGR02246 family)
MTTQTAALEELDRTRDAHVAALNAGDAEAWAECFDADAVQMPPNQPPNVGVVRIREWSRGFLTAFGAEFSLAPQEVELGAPDWAFERGAYEIVLTPRAGGGPLQDAGKYLTIYRRHAGGGWVMAHDIWNSDNPPSG